jgi:hypothetical protein
LPTVPKTPTTEEMQATPYKRGTKVRLLEDIPGHPAGSEGKVAVANGFTWLRYWVRFADGTSVGHIDHHNLVRAKDYERFLVQREVEAEQAARATEEAATAAESGGGDGAAAGGGGDPVVNGVTVPGYLIERSAAARTRLGG